MALDTNFVETELRENIGKPIHLSKFANSVPFTQTGILMEAPPREDRSKYILAFEWGSNPRVMEGEDIVENPKPVRYFLLRTDLFNQISVLNGRMEVTTDDPNAFVGGGFLVNPQKYAEFRGYHNSSG
jgi:hypothetical protein